MDYGHRSLHRRERVFRERTNPFDMYDEREMLDRYRFGKADLWKISAEMLGGELEFDSTRLGGTTTIIQLMITLCILACVGFQILIGDMFDVTKTTVGRPFHRKVGILAGRLRSRVCPTAGDIVRKQNFQPTNFSRICPIHFSPSAFSMDPECGDTKLTLR